MKVIPLILLFCSLFFCCLPQDSNSYSLSVKSIDSIFRAIKRINKVIHYSAIDSTLSKHYYVDKKSKELLSVELSNTLPGTKQYSYRFIYYFHKEVLIKLIIFHQVFKKKYNKGIFYFSNDKIIRREGVLIDDSNLQKPFELLLNFKSFVRMKNNDG